MISPNSTTEGDPYTTPKHKRTHGFATPASHMTEVSLDSVPENQPAERNVQIISDSPVKESVMISSRHSWPLDETNTKKVVYVDILEEHITEDVKAFIKGMVPKAVQLSIHYYMGAQDGNIKEHVGQAGVIEDEHKQLHLVTAKHNTTNESAAQMIFSHLMAQYWVNGAVLQMKLFNENNFDVSHALRLPLRHSFSWHCWDIDSCRVSAAGDTDTGNNGCWAGLTHQNARRLPHYDRSRCFEKAPSGFNLKVGQKVAILVSSFGCTKTATPRTACVSSLRNKLEQSELDQIYGEPGGISLYSGVITFVGADHIEYNINTFKGCSGAIVFLLDGDHRGKAIAIHTGYEPLLDTNVGLKIINGWKPSLAVRGRQLKHSWCTRRKVATGACAAGSTESASAETTASAATSTKEQETSEKGAAHSTEATGSKSQGMSWGELACETAPSSDSEDMM